MIGLLNLGNSNLQSVANALDHLKVNYRITNDYKELKNFDKLLLPGVGTFGNSMDRLNKLYLTQEIKESVIIHQKPILGICLGMQLLFKSSEESQGYEGLDLLEGKVIQIQKSINYKIPRIGWGSSKINFDFLNLKEGEQFDFYYIHSYYAKTKHTDIISIETDKNITAAVAKEHIYGCQFHPEKSHNAGLKILDAFNRL